MDIVATRAYVIEQAKANIADLKAHPDNISVAQQVNASLANIVAMERNMIMHRALAKARTSDAEIVPRLPES